jgi:AraC-like DNA-binding protein
MRVPHLDVVATYIDAPYRRLLDLRPDGLKEIIAFGRFNYSEARPDIPIHRHFGVIEICYRDRGEQYFQLENQTYHMQGGDVFLTLPNEPCSSGGHPTASGVMYWFNLRLPRKGQGMLGLSVPDTAVICHSLLNIPCRLFRAMKQTKPLLAEILNLHDQPDAALRTIRMRQSMVRLLLEVIEGAARHVNSRVSERIAQITRTIQNNPAREFPIRDLAHQAHLSVSRFRSRFKEETGVSPWQFIVMARIEAAKKRLTEGNEPITQMAFSLGFESSQYFATVFKRLTGVTPRAYRRGIIPHGPSLRSDDGQDWAAVKKKRGDGKSSQITANSLSRPQTGKASPRERPAKQ